MSLYAIDVTWVQQPGGSTSGRFFRGTGLWFDTTTQTIGYAVQNVAPATLDPDPVDVHAVAGDYIWSDCGPNFLRTKWYYDGNGGTTTTTEANSPFCGFVSPLTCILGTATCTQAATASGAMLTAGFTGGAYGGLFFSLDGGPEQVSPVFQGVAPGVHVVKVRDDGLAGCERTVSVTVNSTSGPQLPPAPSGPSQRIDFVGQPLWYPLAGQPVGAVVELELWAESAHGAADYAPVLSLRKRVDAQGAVVFRLDALLWPLLRAFVPEIALAAATQVCTTNLLDYYVRTTVTPLDPALPVAYGVSDLRTALRGGLPAEWQGTDYFALRKQLAQLPFLSWQPTGPGIYADGEAKPIVAGQPEWLFFLCTPSLAGAQLQVSRRYRMSATSTPVVDVEPLTVPAGDWPYQLLAIPLRDTRAGFATLTVQVQTTAADPVSLPAGYQFVARSPRTRFLLFTNSVGGLDTVRCEERLEVTLEATTEKVERPARPGEVAPAADRQVSDLSASRKLRLAVGWQFPRELDYLQELVLSREVWQQVNAQLRPLDWSKRSLAPYTDEPTLRGLLIECDYAYAPTAYAPVPYA
jgi:hypothetical protein